MKDSQGTRVKMPTSRVMTPCCELLMLFMKLGNKKLEPQESGQDLNIETLAKCNPN